MKEDEEEGRVEREHDVMSEPPEIDTTRAETPPSRWRSRGAMVVVGLCAANVIVVIMVSGAIALGLRTDGCPVERLAHQVAALNTSLSELVEAVQATVRQCA